MAEWEKKTAAMAAAAPPPANLVDPNIHTISNILNSSINNTASNSMSTISGDPSNMHINNPNPKMNGGVHGDLSAYAAMAAFMNVGGLVIPSTAFPLPVASSSPTSGAVPPPFITAPQSIASPGPSSPMSSPSSVASHTPSSSPSSAVARSAGYKISNIMDLVDSDNEEDAISNTAMMTVRYYGSNAPSNVPSNTLQTDSGAHTSNTSNNNNTDTHSFSKSPMDIHSLVNPNDDTSTSSNTNKNQ